MWVWRKCGPGEAILHSGKREVTSRRPCHNSPPELAPLACCHLLGWRELALGWLYPWLCPVAGSMPNKNSSDRGNPRSQCILTFRLTRKRAAAGRERGPTGSFLIAPARFIRLVAMGQAQANRGTPIPQQLTTDQSRAHGQASYLSTVCGVQKGAWRGSGL